MRNPLGCGILESSSAGLCRTLYQVLALPKPPQPLLPLTHSDIPCSELVFSVPLPHAGWSAPVTGQRGRRAWALHSAHLTLFQPCFSTCQ